VNYNSPTAGADLNETSLENAVIQIAAWTDERGLLIAAKPEKLVVPPALMFVAKRLLDTELRVATADNDINAIKQMGAIPEGLHRQPLLDRQQRLVPDHGRAQRSEALRACRHVTPRWTVTSTPATSATRPASVIRSAGLIRWVSGVLLGA
jgi:hypothetical protein